jgi:hypothetical protein
MSAEPQRTEPTAPAKEGIRSRWLEHAARTSAALAVLAAFASARFTNEFSRTILAQAEASNQWGLYQSKSIKKYLKADQAELIEALTVAHPELGSALSPISTKQRSEVARYEARGHPRGGRGAERREARP